MNTAPVADLASTSTDALVAELIRRSLPEPDVDEDVVDPEETPREQLPITYVLRDAAKVMGVSVRTLYNLNYAGRLPFIRVGKRVLIRRSDIEALVDGWPNS